MKKKATKKLKGFDHHCDWRKASVMLAKCVVATLQTDGKIEVGAKATSKKKSKRGGVRAS